MPADSPPEGWRPPLAHGQGFAAATSFTQRDVDDGAVWYRHFGSGPYSDSFQFQVCSTASADTWGGGAGPQSDSSRLILLPQLFKLAP